MQPAWLTQTKFLAPRLREDLVRRQRLSQALAAAVDAHALTLVSAPAGYGKTTLLASFPQQPLAWVTLDEDDNDPARFFLALIGAFQSATPDFGEDILKLMSGVESLSGGTRPIASALVNELLTKLPTVRLILDDLHLVEEPSVHLALDYMLEHLPPQARLILATRHDPPLQLAKLRARGQLAELRLPELRFTAEEAGTFLNGQQQLGLTPDELAALRLRTEGWPAGLRLLAASLDRMPSGSQRSAFIHTLAQTDRRVFDFLAEEVLKRQDPGIRSFLLETSILPELTGPLCRELTGREDAEKVLLDLYRRNLFLTQLGAPGRTFRYHTLFAGFLQAELRAENPGRFRDLHRHAAELQETRSPDRAVNHLLTAGLWHEAAGLMERVSEPLLEQGLLQTLRAWIEEVPIEVRNLHPRLLYLSGLSMLQRGQLGEAMAALHTARESFKAAGDQAGQGESLLMMVDVASRQHDYPRQASLVQEARAFPLPVHGRVLLLVAQTWQGLFEGHAEQADIALQEAIDLTLASKDVRAFNVLTPILTLNLAFLPGGPERLERFGQEVLSLFGAGGGALPMCAHALLGYLAFLRGSLDEGVAHAERAQAISRQMGGFAYTDAQIHYVLGIQHAMRGDYAAMEDYWSTRLSWVEQTPALRPYQGGVLFMIGHMQWMQGKVEQARRTEAKVSSLGRADEFPEVAVARLVMRVLIEISDRRFAPAEALLGEAMAIARRWPHAIEFVDPRVLLAYLRWVQRRPGEALAEFEPVMTMCEQRRMPGLILRETRLVVPLLQLALDGTSQPRVAEGYLEQLAAAGIPRGLPIPETGQSLTRREIDVLRLIERGASNRAIADKLVISEHTVKVHVSSILAKLEVGSRTRAVARARELHLL